jgi:hypothetical protein
MFQNSSDVVLQDIYRKLIAPYEAQFEPYDVTGIHGICKERNYAYMVSDYVLMIPGHMPQCSITLVPHAFYPGTMAIGAAKRSPYLGILNFL